MMFSMAWFEQRKDSQIKQLRGGSHSNELNCRERSLDFRNYKKAASINNGKYREELVFSGENTE